MAVLVCVGSVALKPKAVFAVQNGKTRANTNQKPWCTAAGSIRRRYRRWVGTGRCVQGPGHLSVACLRAAAPIKLQWEPNRGTLGYSDLLRSA